MEAHSLSRGEAFDELGKKVETFLVKDRVELEAKEANAIGQPNLEARIIDDQVNKVIQKAKGQGNVELGESMENGVTSAADAKSTSELVDSLDQKVIDTLEATDQVDRGKKVCKSAQKNEETAKAAAATSVAMEAELRSLAAKRDGEAKNAKAVCAKARVDMKNNPDDVALNAYKTKWCLYEVAYTLEFD